MADNLAHPSNRCKWASSPNGHWLIRCDIGQVVTIDNLPDEVLLAIFDFYLPARYQGPGSVDLLGMKEDIESWQSLVHVCRRWRGLVFASPRRLNLRLCCTATTPARMSLNVWPALPLLIWAGGPVDNVIAELEHSDRIHQIEIFLNPYTTREIEKLWTAMQVPFPELTVLYLEHKVSSYVPVLPDSFLRGSAPRLRYLDLTSISFPGILKLLLSTTHLVQLHLDNIPHSGYFSPEAIVTCLSALTNLDFLQLGFESPQSCPDLETQPPFLPTRVVLPTLKKFWFKGDSEYLEEFLARIDAPQVYKLLITFFGDIDFNTSELIQFISRTPQLGVYGEAWLTFDDRQAIVKLLPQPATSDDRRVEVNVLCQGSDWQLSFLIQMCTLSLRLLLTMENLYIGEDQHPLLDWKDDIEAAEWLDLLHPFTAVKNLYLSREFAPRIAPALQELTGERTTEVFPALQNLFLEGFQPSEPVQEGIARFISARKLINHPVVISVWDRDLWEDSDSDSYSYSDSDSEVDD